MNERKLFRSEAMEKLRTPDQLGRNLRLVSPVRGLALGILAVTVVGAVVASAIIRVPIVVKAPSVIISSKGVLEQPVTAQHEGRIVSIGVEEGDRVAPDDVIAKIEIPELHTEFALAEADRRQIGLELDDILRLQNDQLAATRSLHEQNRTEINSSVSFLTDRLGALNELRGGLDRLRGGGYVTVDRALQIRSDIADTQDRLADRRSTLLRISLNEKDQASQFAREVHALRSRLSAADRNMARLREQLKRELVIANEYGVVSDVKALPGDLVKFDTPIVSLLPTDDTFSRDQPGPAYLVALVFVPAQEGKRVRPGMDVVIDPRSVRRDIYGNMIGKVTDVSDVPTTTERMRKVLRNDDLARQLSREGAPFLVQVELRRDRRNPSGFAWTSSSGPDVKITAGTLARAEITVERVTLLSLVVPALRELLRAHGEAANDI